MLRPPSSPIRPDVFFQHSLLLLVATGFAALLWTRRLDPWTAAIAGAALAVRLCVILKWFRIPLTERAVRALTIAYIGFYPIDFTYLSKDFLHATVRLVLFLAVMKLLTARTGRDYFFLGLIGLLEMLSAAMLSASLGFLLFLMLFLLFAVGARVSYEIQRGVESAAVSVPPGRTALRIAALSAVVTLAIAAAGVVLFFVVPRAAGAYFARLPATGESMLGFSDQVALDAIGKLKQNSTPVLRIKIDGAPSLPLRWRGVALEHFNGVRWSASPRPVQALTSLQGRFVVALAPQRLRAGTRIHYEVLREPVDTDVLFLAEIPEIISGQFRRIEWSATDSISLPGSRWRPLRYEGSSFLAPERREQPRNFPSSPETVSAGYLELPPIDPRIAPLAHSLTDGLPDRYWKAAAIERYFRTQFGYTLDLPAERPSDPVADFLFRRRKGHCEYFATSMAVMLRTIAIPSRVVNGFQSGVYNPVTGSYTVRASDAHSWVEAYFPSSGWLSFDPTPPDPKGASAPGMLWLYFDALETYWNDWILQYDFGRQMNLARSVERRWQRASFDLSLRWEHAWRSMARAWAGVAASPSRIFWALLIGAGLALASAGIRMGWQEAALWLRTRRVERGAAKAGDCAALYQRVEQYVRRMGWERDHAETPQEFAAHVRAVRDQRLTEDRLSLLDEITAAYNHARFGSDAEAARRLPGLVRVWQGLRW